MKVQILSDGRRRMIATDGAKSNWISSRLLPSNLLSRGIPAAPAIPIRFAHANELKAAKPGMDSLLTILRQKAEGNPAFHPRQGVKLHKPAYCGRASPVG